MDKKVFVEMIEINQCAACLQYRIDHGDFVSQDEIKYVLNVILRITSKYAKRLIDMIEEG